MTYENGILKPNNENVLSTLNELENCIKSKNSQISGIFKDSSLFSKLDSSGLLHAEGDLLTPNNLEEMSDPTKMHSFLFTHFPFPVPTRIPNPHFSAFSPFSSQISRIW